MSHEQIKGKIFLAGQGVPKFGECQAISFLTIVCWHQMIEDSYKQCFLIYLLLLSSVPKWKVGKSPAYAYWLAEDICRLSVKSLQMQ